MASQAKRQGASGRTGTGPRIGHLASLTDILKEMRNVYREMRQGTTKIADGTRLIYALRCMRDVLETIAVERIEDRLDQLEGARDHGVTTHDAPHFRRH
jgi:hypothetical protein